MFSTVATSVDVATATVVTRRVKKKSTKIMTKTKTTTSTKGEVTKTLRKKNTTKTEKLTNIKPPTSSSSSSSSSNNDASKQHMEVDSDVTAVSTLTTATIKTNSATPSITTTQPSTELLQTNPIVHTITLNGNLKKRGIDIGNLPTTTNSTRNRNSRKRGVQWTLKFTNPVSKEDKKKLQEQRQRIVVVGDPLPTLIRKKPIEPPNGETIAAPNTNDDTKNNDTTKNEEMIQLQRERRNASQFIPMWLRREVSWREAVFQHLNLPTNTTKAKSSSYNTYERRNFGESLQGTFYEDTIPNFSEVLRNGTPPSLYDALDILVEQGLGDPSVAERYRTTCRIRLQSMESFTAFSEMKEQIKYRQGLVQQLSTDLIELHERLKALESDPNATTTTTTANSSLPNTASDNESIDSEAISVTNLDHIDDGTEQIVGITDTDVSQFTEIDMDPVTAEKIRHDRIMNLQKMISEKGTNLKIHQYHVDRFVKKLNDLRKVGQEPPMEKEEFQKITDAANRARHSITLAFANHARDLHSKMLDRYQVLDSKTDLTKPHEWYLHARLHKRKIIYHGGPTNSGKTYQALQRLKAAEKGMYVGPLRLLAAEIWERLTAEGIYCNLFTGQEFRSVPFATHKAATVEMVALQEDFDVVVIDEIQMINDRERGFAWTRALLGLRCREIHVCGGLEATDVVKRLVAACGDEFELRTYERFSELEIESSSLASMPDQLGTYKNIQAGDCIVAFSRNDIFAIKREIETNTKHKCCVIYGSLPPSTRSEQARRFNDPNSGYDVLVASDAIGMGMNLNIRRIILNSIFKNDGFNIVRLDHSSVKQISGRAGRRNSPFPNGCTFVTRVLYRYCEIEELYSLTRFLPFFLLSHSCMCARKVVTTRDPRDLDYLRQCLSTEIEPIAKAGLLPTATHIQTFSDALEQLGMQHGTKNLHKILQQFNDIASVKSDFFVCRQDPMVHIAKAIAPYDMAIVSSISHHCFRCISNL